MEHIGEILKRIQTRTKRQSKLLTWSSDEKDPETAADKNCRICQGGGFIHPRLPSGKPDFSRVVPCHCSKAALEKEQTGRLLRYSNLGVLIDSSFEKINETGTSGDPARKGLFKKASEAARAFAADPGGWFVLVGPSGSGKTFLAAAIANERIKRGYPAFFQTVPDLLDHLRSAFAPGSELPYDELLTGEKYPYWSWMTWEWRLGLPNKSKLLKRRTTNCFR
jgi:DNA replication protein DnaC